MRHQIDREGLADPVSGGDVESVNGEQADYVLGAVGHGEAAVDRSEDDHATRQYSTAPQTVGEMPQWYADQSANQVVDCVDEHHGRGGETQLLGAQDQEDVA